MSCILHTIGARVTFPKDVGWINESTGASGTIRRGETAIIKDIDRNKHKLTLEIQSTGRRLIVSAALFETGQGYT